ncbi:MAG: PTS sugar transporter subunit IIA [Tuberibacillus sp.]
MIALVVATHGEFSREIVKSAEMIFGEQENIVAVTFKPGEGLEDLTNKYQQALNELDTKDGVLFLVDLFGGSPFNAAANLISSEENMDMITGVNLPMLIECLAQRKNSALEPLVEAISKTGVEGIKSLKKTLQNSEDEEDL